MEFSTEKYISNFVESQFPEFYRAEGSNFVLFLKAYYEWLEEDGNPVGESRRLMDYRDIDNTLEEFLEFFQKKYLYGIPFDVIINKRYLLKHILDVYRSKSNIYCYKLLFKLIFNEDVDVYLPGRDVLRVSDGKWTEPHYIEVSKVDNLADLIGKTITGVSSKTIAVVESYIREPIYNDETQVLYISGISPKGGSFIIGEKVVNIDYINEIDSLDKAPTVLGSLDSLTIFNSGADFNVGDILKIAHKDPDTNEIASFGDGGLLKVVSLFRGYGSLNFNILNGGFGFTANSQIFLYKGIDDVTGQGASFKIKLSGTRSLVYNTDPLCGYLDLVINAASYGFASNPTANQFSTLDSCLSFSNNIFGKISALTSVQTGNGYIMPANVFVRSTIRSKNFSGTVAYQTNSIYVTGTSTQFTKFFVNNDVIYLQANSANSKSLEIQVIREVSNDTSITLFGFPNNTSTPSTVYGLAPAIMPAQFPATDPIMQRSDGTINGVNDRILALNSSGNNIVEKVIAVDSGKAYIEGEDVHAYRYGILNVPTIVKGGTAYANGDAIIFSGGDTSSPARGSVLVNTSGVITSINVATGAWFGGSGYNSVPELTVRSVNGSGAVLKTSLIKFDTANEIRGTVTKTGIGRGKGFYASKDGFLNYKYIQDSYYYQDYSYELKSSLALGKYKDIFNTTFHPAGSEMFGKIQLYSELGESFNLYSDSKSTGVPVQFLSCDINDPFVTCDDNKRIFVSDYIYSAYWLSVDDDINIRADSTTITADRISKDRGN